MIVLSVVPFRIKPPPEAARSEGPVALTVTVPLPLTDAESVKVLPLIETITVPAPRSIPSVMEVTSMPGIKPAVGVTPVIWLLPDVAVAVN